MAIKALMLRKTIDMKKRERAELLKTGEKLAKREAELEVSIDEVTNEAEQAVVQEAVDALVDEKEKHEKSISELDQKIAELEAELEEVEAAQDAPKTPAPAEAENERSMNPMNVTARSKVFSKMSMQQRDAFFARNDVKAYLGEVRAAIQEKRALTNVGLTIPEVMLGLIKENIEDYSKLYRHVNFRSVAGKGRQLIMGTVPEAIWTDCCATLNELSLSFNDMEVDCFKVGGYFAICNATLEDSDLNLAAELMSALGQAIGLALDKAILYGRNASTTQKMPLGIVSRLAQTEQPSGYPATARAWADLHTTNIITIASGTSGAALISAIVTASGAAKGKYSRGEKTWVMNETTYTALMAATVSTDAQGRIVTGVSDTMPVVGGTIEVLSFLPDNVIIGGYFDLYLLAERAGSQFATSEHVRFLQDQTVFKGTARYDGGPVIAEGFVAIGINGTKPAATMTFPTDTANN